VYFQYNEYGVKADEETRLNAEKFANKVIESQPESADSYYLMGKIERIRGSASKAIKYFKKAYNINPDNADVLLFLGNAYGVHAGRTSIAKKMYKRLFETDPLTPVNYAVLGIFQMVEGQLDDSLSSIQKYSDVAGDDIWQNLYKAYIYAWQKRRDEVFELVEKMVKQESLGRIHDIHAEWCLFFKYALQGEKKKALETITEDVKSYFWNDPEFMWLGVCNYALIDEKEEALNWVEHIIDRGWINYPFLSERAPFLENIRGEPRFKKLMERVKHEWENFEV
jgi:tetratricopeptide (TPR) repeat protein